MSTDVYAGQLCATHLNETISHPSLEPGYRWWIGVISHAHDYGDRVKIVALAIASDVPNARGRLPRKGQTLKLACDDIVTVGRR